MSNGYTSHQANGSIDDRDLGSQVALCIDCILHMRCTSGGTKCSA